MTWTGGIKVRTSSEWETIPDLSYLHSDEEDDKPGSFEYPVFKLVVTLLQPSTSNSFSRIQYSRDGSTS